MKKCIAAVPATLNRRIAAVPAALNRIGLIGIIAGLLIMISAPTNAALTEPLGPDSVTGKVLFETLDSLYGLDNLTRVDDYDSAIVDQYWTFADEAVTATALARAKFADFTHMFGFLYGSEGDRFKPLFNTGQSYYGVFDDEGRAPQNQIKKEASFTSKKAGPVFRFGLKILSQPGYIWSSAPSDNVVMPKGTAGDGIDHMITYQVTGNDGYSNNTIGNYIIAWEDLRADNAWGQFDGDYGDLVVELSGVQPMIPEPYSIVLFSLAGLALLRHSRRAKTT